MAIFRKNEDQHAGSGLDKPDPKTLTEKIADTVKAALPAKDNKAKNEMADPAALDIPPAD
jgi:hypothetical protein